MTNKQLKDFLKRIEQKSKDFDFRLFANAKACSYIERAHCLSKVACIFCELDNKHFEIEKLGYKFEQNGKNF